MKIIRSMKMKTMRKMLYNHKNKISLPSWIILVSGRLFVSFTACNTGKSTASGESAKESDGFVSICDGNTLNGWEGWAGCGRVEDGDLVGFTTDADRMEANTCLIWRGGQR